jgi:hypothetical protein
MRPKLSAAAAMVVRALTPLGVDVASHLVGNATASFFFMEDAEDETLPTIRAALEGVVASDRRARAAHPDYPHTYPEDVSDLLDELAEVWRNVHAGRYEVDPVGALVSHVDLSSRSRDLKIRRSSGRWYVSVRDHRRVIARADHPMLEVAAELCLRLLPCRN